MTKSAAQRFNVVKKLAERREQHAASELSAQQQKVEAETQQLSRLQTYYEDYLQRIDQQRHQVKGEDLLTYREFTHRLAEAVRQQTKKIDTLNKGLQGLRQQWLQLRQKRIALEDLIEKKQLEENHYWEVMEQKVQDDESTQKFVRNSRDE